MLQCKSPVMVKFTRRRQRTDTSGLPRILDFGILMSGFTL